jgi:hypothetical protein
LGRGLVLVPAIAFAREPIKPKPARRALNLAKLMTGAGGLGKYANVMSPKQLPLRLGTLQKARAVWSESRGATPDRACRPHLLAQPDQKPATRALNLVNPMTGAGGLGNTPTS